MMHGALRFLKGGPSHVYREMGGQALVEWVLLLCLISILGIAVLATFGPNTAAMVNRVGRSVTASDSAMATTSVVTAEAGSVPQPPGSAVPENGRPHGPEHRAGRQLQATWMQARQLSGGGQRLQLPILLVLMAILGVALLSVVAGVVRGVMEKSARESMLENELSSMANFEQVMADVEVL